MADVICTAARGQQWVGGGSGGIDDADGQASSRLKPVTLYAGFLPVAGQFNDRREGAVGERGIGGMQKGHHYKRHRTERKSHVLHVKDTDSVA